MKILKTGFLLFVIVWLLNCSASKNEILVSLNSGNPNLQQRGEYLHFQSKPFDGLVTEVYETGDIKSQTHYKRGLVDGPVTRWYPGGMKESARYFERDEKVGVHSGWWPNGNLRFEYHFRAGLYHGTFKEWYENGRPLHLFHYDHGNEVKAIGWRDNGKTYINFAVRNGRKYGLTNARLCYSLKDGQGVYKSSNN